MIGLQFPEIRSAHLLGGAALLLAGIALWPWIVPPVPAPRPLATSQAAAATPVAVLPPIVTYAAFVERPLFAPSRRAPPGAVATALAPAIESRYRLIGVMSAGPKHRAFIADGPRRTQIIEGDTLDGWQVKQIAQDRVILTSPAGEAALKLGRAPPEPPKVQ